MHSNPLQRLCLVQLHRPQLSTHCKLYLLLGLMVCIQWTAAAVGAAVMPAEQSCCPSGRGGLVPLKTVPVKVVLLKIVPLKLAPTSHTWW